MLHSTKLLNKILISLMALILLFNTNYGAFKITEANANTLSANFENWAAAQYATVVTTTTAIAAGAMHTQQYVLDNATEMYNTAKATWPKMSADMKADFLASLNQSADGIVAVGDWITAALDSLGNVFGKAEGPDLSDKFTPDYGNHWNAWYDFSQGYYLKIGSDTGTHVYIYRDHDALARVKLAYSIVATISGKDKIDSLFNRLSTVTTPGGLVGALASVGISSSVLLGDTVIDVNSESTYNRLDNWIRERYKQQDKPLKLYNPGAQAYSTDGYRLGLSADGQTLLKLPDGIPWEGTADWKQPLLNTIDGTSAVLDTAVGSWLDVATGKKIRDATIAEMASGTGVDESTAEFVLIKAKEEEQAREERENSGEVENLSRAQKRNLETLDNIVEGHLKESDFSGTLRDLQGKPVPKPGGGYWNHLKEMKDSYKGLNKIKKGLEGSLKNPNLNETERKILQEALDKVNSYNKKIEDLFSGYGGIKGMFIGTTIGEIYNLPSPNVYDDYSLEQWYTELYNKRVEGLSKLDVIRMLEQNILEDLAIKKAIEFLHVDPLMGIKFDGQLMETLLSTDVIKLGKYMEEIKNLVSGVSLKLNDLDWVSIEDKEEYADLITEFQNKITKNR